MPADSSGIDQALIALLGADAALLALCPNGAYWDVAPPSATRFVIVSFVEEVDGQMFGGRAFEDGLYLVKAVMLSSAAGDIRAAAARIDTLLESDGSPPTLTVSGFREMTVHRESRIRYTEVDDGDNSIRWLHRGGHYRVAMSTT